MGTMTNFRAEDMPGKGKPTAEETKPKATAKSDEDEKPAAKKSTARKNKKDSE